MVSPINHPDVDKDSLFWRQSKTENSITGGKRKTCIRYCIKFWSIRIVAVQKRLIFVLFKEYSRLQTKCFIPAVYATNCSCESCPALDKHLCRILCNFLNENIPIDRLPNNKCFLKHDFRILWYKIWTQIQSPARLNRNCPELRTLCLQTLQYEPNKRFCF